MDRASTQDRLRAHCGAVCEAVLAPVACVNERSQAAAKIVSEGRPRARRLSIVKSRFVKSRFCEIALLVPSNDLCIASPAEFPANRRRLVRCSVSQREDDFFRTKLRMRVCATVFDGSRAICTILRSTWSPEFNVTRAPLIPHALTRRRTQRGRERPPSIGAMGQGLGDRGGSLTPHISLHASSTRPLPRHKAPRRHVSDGEQRLSDQSIASCGTSGRAAHWYRPRRGNRLSFQGPD
jgi:hypothetical protein